MILRPYQQTAIREINAARMAGDRPLLVCPTGGGKTEIFLHLATTTAERVLIAVHRNELVEQISKRIGNYPHGIVQSGVRPRPTARVQIASIQTLVNRLDRYAPDVIIFDEAHHAVSNTWGRVIAAYPNAALVGVTATPCRLDGSGLRDAGFTILVQGPTTAELMQQGYLTPAHVYGVPLADTTGARVRFGDYVRADLDHIMSKPSITGDAIRHYRKFADGLPAIGFCISVAKAEETAEAFRAAGYAAASIDGKKSPMERRRLIRTLGNGCLQVLTSCDLISEGVDVPVVSCGILLRPTQSLGLYLQQVGRCLRPAPGKTHAVILDHVGNVMRHGMPDSPRVWSLDGPPRRTRATDPDDSPVRICLECYRAHDTAPVCPFCGFVYPAKPREIQQVDGDLQLLDWASVPEIPVAKPLEECRSLRDLQAFAKSRGMKPGWAWLRWQGMKGKGAA